MLEKNLFPVEKLVPYLSKNQNESLPNSLSWHPWFYSSKQILSTMVRATKRGIKHASCPQGAYQFTESQEIAYFLKYHISTPTDA